MEQPSETKKSEQAAAILILSVIIIIALIYLVIKPQMADLKKNNLVAAKKGIELDNKDQQISNIKELEPKIKAAQAKVKKLAIALPTSQKVGEILVQIESMATNSRVALTALTPSGENLEASTETTLIATGETGEEAITGEMPTGGEPQIGQYTFSLSVEGSYGSIVKFVRSVETNLRPIKIEKAEFSAGEGADPGVTATFNMSTFYQK